MENHTLAIVILVLSLSIFWHAQTNRYQIAVLEPTRASQDEGSFIKFDTRTAEALEYCDLYKGYCQKWEKYREAEDLLKNKEPSLTELTNQKIK